MWSRQVRAYVRLKDLGVCSNLSIDCNDGEAATFLAVCMNMSGWEQVESAALSFLTVL